MGAGLPVAPRLCNGPKQEGPTQTGPYVTTGPIQAVRWAAQGRTGSFSTNEGGWNITLLLWVEDNNKREEM